MKSALTPPADADRSTACSEREFASAVPSSRSGAAHVAQSRWEQLGWCLSDMRVVDLDLRARLAYFRNPQIPTWPTAEATHLLRARAAANRTVRVLVSKWPQERIDGG